MSTRCRWLALLLAGAALPAAAQPDLLGGELLPRQATDPAAAVAALAPGEATWIGWSVPGLPEAAALCCQERRSRRSHCTLDASGGGWGSSRDQGRPTEPADLYILAQVESGAVRRLETVGASCPVEAAGHRVVWLEGVEAESSLSWIAALAWRTGSVESSEDLAERAVGAIAYHAAPAADRRLALLARDSNARRGVREAALFWSGELRGAAGFELLDAALATERDGDLREHAIFALTLSRDGRALPRLRRAATEDLDPDLRGQALFWLGQSGDPRAGGWILSAIESDRDGEVREQAVFALSQLEDGTPQLIRLLRESKDPDVRRQALFWLGQADDPRAIAALEDLLNAGS